MPTTLLGERDDVVPLVFGDECLFETAKAVDGLLAQMGQQGVAFPWDRELAQGLEADLLSFDREKRSIPGIHNSTRRKVLIEQLLESVRRVKYVEVIRTLKLSNRRADPNDVLFDPLKAAILCQRRRNIQDVKSNMVFGHFLNQQQRVLPQLSVGGQPLTGLRARV